MSMVVLVALLSFICDAQACPDSSANLRAITVSISNSQRAGRAPAAADCGFQHATTYNFSDDAFEDGEVAFFIAAADAHRAAADMRKAAEDKEERDQYLDHEIELRKMFLKKALGATDPSTPETLRPKVVKHLSALAQAMSLRQQYFDLTNYLRNQPATFIDEAAVEVWLAALRSCAKWDGNYADVCAGDNKAACQAPIAAFFRSVDAMVARNPKPTLQDDLRSLRIATSAQACKP
jgi:hypothetical protein